MPYAEMEGTWSKLPLIAKHAQENPDLQFTSLAHLLDKRFLMDSFHSLNRNKAVGVDNVSWEPTEWVLRCQPESRIDHHKQKRSNLKRMISHVKVRQEP
jgi:hypothetical protein